MKRIEGGVCAAKGFKANGIHCGIRHNRTKRDLCMIVSDVPAAAAAVYTQNLVKGAPIAVTKRNIANGIAQAVICNSGNANTCNADGELIAQQMCGLVESATGIAATDVIVASTGVIGQPLNLEPIAKGMEALVSGLDYTQEAGTTAAEAIMTTDTVKKEVAVEFTVGGKVCRMGGIAKGSGMIHPNLATMLVFITTDAAISAPMLQKALRTDVQATFNMLSIDGDTSTNDTVAVMANGLAGNQEITAEGEDFTAFMEALNAITVELSRRIVADGEGATKLLECVATGADTLAAARAATKSVVCSSLFKSAMFGADANWGRILCAIGYSGADLDISKIGVSLRSKAGSIEVCKNGAGVPFSEEIAKKVLLENEIEILLTLGDGPYSATAWGCDLTYDYVKINGDYRT